MVKYAAENNIDNGKCFGFKIPIIKTTEIKAKIRCPSYETQMRHLS
jgi:hypothetical protein